jgi:hypothetical protein
VYRAVTRQSNSPFLFSPVPYLWVKSKGNVCMNITLPGIVILLYCYIVNKIHDVLSAIER